MRGGSLGLALALGLALPVRAEPSYWTAVLQPERTRALRLVQDGQAQLSPTLALGLLSAAGLPLELAAQRALALESARARFALACELDPTLREARLAHADALAMLDDETSRAAAIAELHALRELDPWYEAEQVALQLGVLHARGRELSAAHREYERALALRTDERRHATVLLDLAEVEMFEGQLERALALYDQAASEGDASGRVLALWGRAVALDRMGELAPALLAARRALDSDRAPFAALHHSGVFFVPDYELFYYEALGELALSELEPSTEVTPELLAELRAYRPRRREAHALRALIGFDRYLRADGGQGPFAEAARAHIEQLTTR